jgi:hypothetical protein
MSSAAIDPAAIDLPPTESIDITALISQQHRDH